MGYDQAAARASADRAAAALGAALAAQRSGARKGLDAFAVEFTNEMKARLTNPSPSPQGGFPGLVSGQYRAAWSWRSGQGPTGPFVDVGPLAGVHPEGASGDHAEAKAHHAEVKRNKRKGGELSNGELGFLLEYGTSRMHPRPHMRPLLEEFLPRVRASVAEGIALEQRELLRGIADPFKGVLRA